MESLEKNKKCWVTQLPKKSRPCKWKTFRSSTKTNLWEVIAILFPSLLVPSGAGLTMGREDTPFSTYKSSRKFSSHLISRNEAVCFLSLPWTVMESLVSHLLWTSNCLLNWTNSSLGGCQVFIGKQLECTHNKTEEKKEKDTLAFLRKNPILKLSGNALTFWDCFIIVTGN